MQNESDPDLLDELRAHAPFAQMSAAALQAFVAAAQPRRFRAGELLLAPEHGPVAALWWLRRGAVLAQRGVAEAMGGIRYERGEMFPVGALLGARPVSARYTAQGEQGEAEGEALLLPAAAVQALAAQSPPFADFLSHRVAQFLALSRRALQVSYASQTLSEQSLEAPLAQLAHKTPYAVRPETPLREALQTMHERRIGSVLVADSDGVPLGILTRHDVLARITLPQLSLATPIAEVMSRPLHCLNIDEDSAQDAALLMSRQGLRHVPLLRQGRLAGIVSERDLFALQRLSLKQVSSAIRAAADVATLRIVAQDIRRFARNLLAQGVAARQLTELIAHLNDVLTQRLVQLCADALGLDLGRACWLAFGSEGRGEQTIATDQDNGLIFESDDPVADRPRWLALGQAVNAALDACGYPLCKGGVMAGNPACCLSLQEWLESFSAWMEHGAPEDLLRASIYFDFRPLYGAQSLAAPLRALVQGEAARLPRFMRQMADNALRTRAPLSWLGALETRAIDGREGVDLKLQGTALFVDLARLYALAQGLDETGTRARLEAAGRALQVPAHEREGWVGAFEFLQMLRLRVQMEPQGGAAANPNWIALDSLNDIDRRMLKESFKIAKRLQQRLELDYRR